MQIKKRAKAVNFGKKPEAPKEHHEEAKQQVDENIESSHKPPEEQTQGIVDQNQALESSLEASRASAEKETENNPEPVEEENLQEETVQDLDTASKIPDEPTISEPKNEAITAASPLLGDTYIIEKEVQKNMLGYFILIAVIAFVVGLISMAALTFFLPKADMLTRIPFLTTAIPTATPIPKPTSVPTPTPQKVDLAKYNIKILNGSGITGAASKLKQTLVSEGFKVTSTSNADNSEYTETMVVAKKDIESSYLTKLNDALMKTYSVAPLKEMATGAAEAADVIITIGTEPAK